MSQTLAAVGAVLMAVLQSTIVPFLVVDGATPDLLLVYAIVLAVIIGLDHGVVLARLGELAGVSAGLPCVAVAPRRSGWLDAPEEADMTGMGDAADACPADRPGRACLACSRRKACRNAAISSSRCSSRWCPTPKPSKRSRPRGAANL